MKKILITGADSYIGTSFESYMKQFDGYQVDTLDMINPEWREKSFKEYDVIFHVAGIAHIKETDKNREQYYKINRDLTLEVANKAQESGVLHFIVMSSMSVYGKVVGNITKNSECNPVSAYGKSKLQADEQLITMQTSSFKVTILRPPMIYGKDCKGNYQQLRKFALKSPVFPRYCNKRSMIFIDNLSYFIKDVIDHQKSGIFIPQNEEYVCTSEMVDLIAKFNNKKIRLIGLFNIFIKVFRVSMIKKVFGNLTYEKEDLVCNIDFEQSIKLTEEQ